MDRLDFSQDMTAAARWLAELVALLSPFGTDSRLHWTGLAAFVVLGLAVYLWQERRAAGTGAGPLAFLFPPALYRTQSSWVDVKVYVAGRLIKPFINVAALPIGTLIMALTAAAVAEGVSGASPGELGRSAVDPAALICASLLVAIVNDLSYYVIHRISHEADWLWPFHKLHHSAEVLTPITAKRNHPVFDLLRALVGVLMVAPINGAILGLFGVVELTLIFGLNVLIAIMNLTGGALRHSHIWLDFGPVMDRIFISPAQHQIHHSLAPEHHDRNYGLTLAVWDWMFGTLYIPERREELSFGVADRDGTPEPQVHRSLKEAYLVPFVEAAEVVRRRDRPLSGERA